MGDSPSVLDIEVRGTSLLPVVITMLSAHYWVIPVILLGGILPSVPPLMSTYGECSSYQYLVRPEVKILERLPNE